MEPNEANGQAAPADLSETTAAAPVGDEGQSISPDQTTSNGPDLQVAQGESFFDPKSIEHSPELMLAYKQMQGKFTQGQQAIRADQQKIDAYNSYLQDPMGTIRQIVAQQGMTLVNGGPQPQEGQTEFSPKSWEDVVTHIRSQLEGDLKQQYQPLVNQVRDLKQQNVETYLDSNHTDWRTYEGEMISSLQAHPSLAADPDLLYRMSVPPEVLEARATARALERLKTGTEGSVVPGANRATLETSSKPTGKLSFNEAVDFAKSQLKSRGIGPVGS